MKNNQEGSKNPSQSDQKNQKQLTLTFSKNLQLLPKVLPTFKKLKIAILAFLLALIVLIYLALLLGQTNQQPQKPHLSQEPTSSPNPQVSKEEERETINKKVGEYNQKIDQLDTSFQKLTPPIVDLEIRFE